jgi:hypothetical protein
MRNRGIQGMHEVRVAELKTMLFSFCSPEQRSLADSRWALLDESIRLRKDNDAIGDAKVNPEISLVVD